MSQLKNAVELAIDQYPSGIEFFGRDLQKEVARYYPKAMNMYTDTILRCARKYRRESFECINKTISLYKKV